MTGHIAAVRAAEKVRRQPLVATAMQVFMRANEFNNDPKYANQATFKIETTCDTMALVADALSAARRLWRDGFRYAKKYRVARPRAAERVI